MKIPVFKPSVGDAEVEAVSKVLRSGWVGQGPKVIEFENEFKKYIGCEEAIAVNSATSGLQLMIELLKHPDPMRDEVITTPVTFVSTNHAILYNGLKPVFADVEPDTLNIDPNEIEKLVGPKTSLIIVVHCAGHPCYMDRIYDIATTNILEDSAHALGSKHYTVEDGTRNIGKFGYNVFSFAAIKNITTGDGGMITGCSSNRMNRLKRLRWMGIDKSTYERSTGTYSWEYDVTDVGYKMNMTDISAALGIVQLSRIESLNAQRRVIRYIYDAEFRNIEELETPPQKSYASKLSCHHYIIKTYWRDALANYLREQGIGTSLHHKPNHLYDIYKPYYRKLPVAERAFKRMITIPLFPTMTMLEVEYVVDHIKRFFK